MTTAHKIDWEKHRKGPLPLGA